MPKSIIYLNGDYLPEESATVSVMDRGFLFGDGIYEVIPVFGNRMLREDEHLHRLHNSLQRVSLGNPHTNDEWKTLLHALLEKNPGDDRAIYLQITRGVYAKRELAIDTEYPPTIFIMVLNVSPVEIKTLQQGISAITVEDFRWHACDIKSVSLIANVMLKQQATSVDAVDAILVRDGNVTEGTASNIFIVKDGIIITPPKSEKLLPGITRDLVIEIATHNDMPYEERDIAEQELDQADEIWLTSSTREIAPVILLNKRQVADGKAGPVWHEMIDLYQQYKHRLRSG